MIKSAKKIKQTQHLKLFHEYIANNLYGIKL